MTNENQFIKCYHVKHRLDFKVQLAKAKQVADYAVQHKSTPKKLTTKYVNHLGLHSTIACQILRKYGRGTIKEAKHVNLIISNSINKRKYKKKDGTIQIKTYSNMVYENGWVTVKPLKLKFRWNPGKTFRKIHQLEIDETKFMIAVSFPESKVDQEYQGVLGIDLNCGMGRSVVNCANLNTRELLNLGKQGPNLRKFHFKKRKVHPKKMKGNKEQRRMRDLDHKISRTVVNYALKHKLKIVMENLKGLRKSVTKKKGLPRNVNRFVNSWSFYRLQTFIEYKAKELGIPFEKINPQYTSQECSYCSVIGKRNGDTFVCTNKKCQVRNKKRHADINAAFNIGNRSLLLGGRAH